MLYGRNHVAEPMSSLLRIHRHDGRPLKPVDHEPKIPVLNQENLISQGIDTSTLVPGAKTVDALGSCVANASTAALSTTLPDYRLARIGIDQDPVLDEKFAIELYHQLTDATGDPATEWPPTDCGSSGLAACSYLEQQGLIAGHKIAHSATDIVSLMQDGGLIVGQPYLNVWEQPNSAGFIDGDGGLGALAVALRYGVAGGHETFWSAIEDLHFDVLGRVDADKTIIRFRNSWSSSWADHGSARAHLSTFVALAHWCDFRQFVPAA